MKKAIQVLFIALLTPFIAQAIEPGQLDYAFHPGYESQEAGPIRLVDRIGVHESFQEAKPEMIQASFQAQETRKRFGVGAQASFPAFGLSAVYNINDAMAVQGIVGYVGSFKDIGIYGGRFLYRFRRGPSYNIYGYGMVGSWTWSSDELDLDTAETSTVTETTMGYGVGAGIEYFFSGLPRLGLNAEAGFALVNFDEVDYNYSSFVFGAGAHYYF